MSKKDLLEITKKVVSPINEGLNPKKIWKKNTDKHNYPAAEDYLDLIVSCDLSEKLVRKLRRARMTHKKAKDILRASRLPLLPIDNVHVKANIDKVHRGKKLSPVLLVRHDNLIIADGYHRVCAIYYLSEDYNIPCKLV